MALTGWGFHPAARERKQNSPAGRLETRCCRHCQTAARLGRRVGDRPSARCIPSHDRHCLMNITEAVPSCQAARVPAESCVSQSQTEERSNIAICTQKVSWLESASWTRPTGAEGQRAGAGLAFVPSHHSANPAHAIGAPTPTGRVDPREEWQESPRPRLLTRTRAPGCDPSRRGKLLLELPAST